MRNHLFNIAPYNTTVIVANSPKRVVQLNSYPYRFLITLSDKVQVMIYVSSLFTASSCIAGPACVTCWLLVNVQEAGVREPTRSAERIMNQNLGAAVE